MKTPTRWFAAAILTLVGATAAADTPVEARIKVQSDASAEELYRKLQIKARQQCRVNTVITYSRIALERACRREFMDNGVIKIGRPDLTALHREKTGP